MNETRSKGERIITIATRALEQMRDSQVEEPHTARKILEYALESELITLEEAEELQASWYVTMSWSAHSDDTRIAKQVGKRGYFLVSTPPADAEVSEEGEQVGIAQELRKPAYQQREAKLYEVMKTWLGGLGYRADVVSKKRVGGTWRNPDVAGILVTSNLGGGVDVEIATIEVKLNVERVDERFFKAVAHKRFANRAYFARPTRENEKIHSEFREAAERFNVGVLLVRLQDADYEALINGNVGGLEISDENVDVEEYWPAVFEPIPAAKTDSFLKETLDISVLEDLYTFGINPQA